MPRLKVLALVKFCAVVSLVNMDLGLCFGFVFFYLSGAGSWFCLVLGAPDIFLENSRGISIKHTTPHGLTS